MTVRGPSRWLSVPDRPPAATDCFVVPSYALVDATRPTLPTIAEIRLAVEWWRCFPDAVVIMSTGDNQRLGVSNAEVMASYAVGLGLPRDRVIEERRSRNTIQNLIRCDEIMRERGLTQPTLVTLDLYTRRAVATATKLGWTDFSWLSAYSEGEPAAGWKRLQTRSRLTIALYELGAMAYSVLRGWATPPR